MSRFEQPFNIWLTPKYKMKEKISHNEAMEFSETSAELGGMDIDIPSADIILTSGGRFDWQLYGQEADKDNPLANIHLMRIWCTQMFGQLAKGKAYTNETDAKVSVDLSVDELETLNVVLQKVSDSIHKEFERDIESIITKTKLKKLDF